MITENVVIASDHAGYILKEKIVKHLKARGVIVEDLGTESELSVDYPDYGHPLARAVEEGLFHYGISICGSGNGISMTVNKYPGIRAALCWNEDISRLARLHNDANICSLPARFIDTDLAFRIVDIFLDTEFEGGRHIARINKIPLKS